MGECGSEICPVDIGLSGTFGEEESVTSRTKDVDGVGAR
jgi:hypothetical protein